MNDKTAKPLRVPPRLVLASIVGLWACYFVLTTLRGALLGYEFNWAFVSRRLVVTLGSIAVTAALWPLLAVLARWPLWRRAALMLVVALPVALFATMINSMVFADLDHEAKQREQQQSVNVLDDGEGNVVEIGGGHLRVRSGDGAVVELGDGKLVVHKGKDAAAPRPATPPPAPSPPAEASPSPPPPATKIHAAAAQEKRFWDEIVDMALGRYFLLVAWMALYLALENAQQARAAERREGEYRRAAQASELRSLRYQINPHFLFNTLNSLSALVLTGKPTEAERMIQTIATFYRRSLAGDPTGDLALAQEIKLQKLYLEIEAVRFPERLRTAFDVPDDLADVLVPGMILQPLVENSIKYAVAATTRPVTVTIAARAEAGRLVLSVGDDGPGAAVWQDGCGIGLANVRDRLHARFDGAASLDAGPEPGGGFRTVIRLPLEHRDG
jgi:anti-sigma regulatory factor (Ser/Thr protein kinase)